MYTIQKYKYILVVDKLKHELHNFILIWIRCTHSIVYMLNLALWKLHNGCVSMICITTDETASLKGSICYVTYR